MVSPLFWARSAGSSPDAAAASARKRGRVGRRPRSHDSEGAPGPRSTARRRAPLACVVGSRVYAFFFFSAAGAGGAVAWRHVYLQGLPPDQVPACGPGLGYMLDNFPLGDALKMVFTGSGECANIDWQFLGLSMPTWVLIAVLGLGGLGIWNNFRATSAPLPVDTSR